MTSSSNRDEVEKSYEDNTIMRNLKKAKFVIIIVHFNTMGHRSQGDLEHTGHFGLREQNKTQKMLLNFISIQNLYCVITFHQKQNRANGEVTS